MKCHKIIYFHKKNENIYNNENRKPIQSKPKFFGSDFILKQNQLDEQITKLKRLDRMVFPCKTEPIQSANTPRGGDVWGVYYFTSSCFFAE